MLRTLTSLDYNRELIELLFDAKVSTILITILGPVLFYLIFESIIPQNILLIWIFLHLLVYAMRIQITSKISNDLFIVSDGRIRKLLSIYLFIVFLSSLLWGASTILVIKYADETHIVFMVVILFGIMTGSISRLTSVFHAVFIFITTLTLSVMAGLLIFSSSEVYYYLMGSLAFYLFIALPTAFKIYSYMDKSIMQKEEIVFLNTSLEKKISDATYELENKNLTLQESVESFQNLLDATMEGIIISDINKKILDINKSGVELLGCRHKTEIIGRKLFNFVPSYEEANLSIILAEEKNKTHEMVFQKKNGEVFPTLASGKNIIKNGIKLRISTIQDLTQIKDKEKLLLEQSRLAQMGEMISMIAHQWRQPLGAISSAVFSVQTKLALGKFDLDKREGIDQLVEFLEKKHGSINQYVEFLSATIDDFRNFFKPDKSKESVMVTIPIHRALQIVKSSIESKGIYLETHFECNEAVDMYQNEMMQVILNILKNAEDNFMEKGIEKPKIIIRTYLEDKNYVISLLDNGGGIPDDILVNIFDPYFSTKEEKNGSGLGLYMSKTMVEEHSGGHLLVENRDDGVEFKIILPPV
jgi:PAS domain S-box-containing protein